MTMRSRISLAARLPAEPSVTGSRRQTAPFLILAACGGIIAASVPTFDVSPSKPSSRAISQVEAVHDDHAPAQPPLAWVTQFGASANDRVVQTLAEIVAKRYRVATDAARGLVAIAYQEARRNRLDPLLLLAVIAVESRFNPIAESGGGALGLMQIVPKYHVQTVNASTRATMLDPQHNIGLGAQVLKQYVKTGGTEIAGLQLYNGSADDATNAYANRVMTEKQGLEDLLRRARDRA